MTKPYLLLVLVLGHVLVQTSSAKAILDEKSSAAEADSDDDSVEDSNTESEEESDSDDEDQKEENPAPSCLLFGNQACHVQCTVTAEAYDVKAEGHCDDNQTCQCHISGDVSFHERWAHKFDADYVYRKINQNGMVYEQAQRIFDFPLRTAEQFKQLFQPIISPYQFTKLKTHDESMAAKFTEKGQDKVDTEAVQKYVTEKVGKLMKSSAKSLLATKYKDNFKNALDNSKDEPGTLYNLTYRTRQLKNKTLEDILKEHLKKNSLEEPKVDADDDKCLAVILTNAVTNEIIKLNDEKSAAAAAAAAAKKKASAAKKPAGKKAPAKKPAAKKPADKSTTDKGAAGESTAKPKPAAKAKSDAKKA